MRRILLLVLCLVCLPAALLPAPRPQLLLGVLANSGPVSFAVTHYADIETDVDTTPIDATIMAAATHGACPGAWTVINASSQITISTAAQLGTLPFTVTVAATPYDGTGTRGLRYDHDITATVASARCNITADAEVSFAFDFKSTVFQSAQFVALDIATIEASNGSGWCTVQYVDTPGSYGIIAHTDQTQGGTIAITAGDNVGYRMEVYANSTSEACIVSIFTISGSTFTLVGTSTGAMTTSATFDRVRLEGNWHTVKFAAVSLFDNLIIDAAARFPVH